LAKLSSIHGRSPLRVIVLAIALLAATAAAPPVLADPETVVTPNRGDEDANGDADYVVGEEMCARPVATGSGGIF